MFIALPLSENICLPSYGLASVEWREEFFVECLNIGSEDPASVCEALEEVDVPPFQINVTGIRLDERQKLFWAAVNEPAGLSLLLKTVNKNLKEQRIRTSPSRLQIVLGRYQTLSPQRVADYLETHGGYFSEPFWVTQFDLRAGQRSIQSFDLRT